MKINLNRTKKSERKSKMQRLLKKSRLLLISYLAATAVTSCTSRAPKPPEIELGMIDIRTPFENSVVLCSKAGSSCPSVPLKMADSYITVSPAMWEKQQNYIDLLVCVIDGGCGASGYSAMASSLDSGNLSTEIKKYQAVSKKIRARLLRSRK